MEWTLEVTKKGERQATLVGYFGSQKEACDEAEKRSPRGIYWSRLKNGSIGVTNDAHYMILRCSA
jgi:hypothetical protein